MPVFDNGSVEGAVVALSVLSEAQGKDLTRHEEVLKELRTDNAALRDKLVSTQTRLTKLETSNSGTKEIIKTIVVPIVLSLATALVTYYLKGPH